MNENSTQNKLDWRVIGVWAGMAAVIIVLLWTMFSYRFWKDQAELEIANSQKKVMEQKKTDFVLATEIAAVILDPLLYRNAQNSSDLQSVAEAMVKNVKAEQIIIMDQRGFVVASSDLKFVKTLRDGDIKKGESAEETGGQFAVTRPVKHGGTILGWVKMNYKLN